MSLTDRTTAQRLREALLLIKQLRNRVDSLESDASQPIAVVGLSCRLPQARDPDEYWSLLRRGGDAITTVPASRFDVDAFFSEDPSKPGILSSRNGGFLNEVDRFDAEFFGISPREASQIDPQHRLLLELSWEAIESAGLAPSSLRSTNTGVFMGISGNEYAHLLLGRGTDAIDAHLGTGASHSAGVGRISHFLGLEGPNVAVDTACSSSLVALHQAVRSLQSLECDCALAGGVSLILSPSTSIAFSKAGMLAADGRCKTFDAAADGYGRGEGAGVVVLKRLSDAQRCGDPVLAVIRGTGVNQDGASGGLTVPNGPAQEEVIRRALDSAGLAPDAIDYLEAHGTGTSLGDPIEIQAAASAFGEGRPSNRPLIIGSAKTNIGHLEAAAGIAGLIKVILALQNETIPAHLHFQNPNSAIDWKALPVRVCSESMPWPSSERPRVAGISSFGFSGTNAHAVIEEAAKPVPSAPSRHQRHVMVLSARSASALRELADRYTAWLESNPGANLADFCFTAATGRNHFRYRAALTGQTRDELADGLARISREDVTPSKDRPKAAWLFTGQGSHWPKMAEDLFESEPVFRNHLLECEKALPTVAGRPFLEMLFGDDNPLDKTENAQPALFAIQSGLIELYRSWGLKPNIVLGHSLGEYSAAYAAGVISRDDGLRLVAARGRLMGTLPETSGMAAVFADVAAVQSILSKYSGLTVAALNGAHQVISGKLSELHTVVEECTAAGIRCQILQSANAFHSAWVDPILDEFETVAAKINFASPQCLYISNVSGVPFQAGQTIDARYWRNHARETVQFALGLQQIQSFGCDLLLEIGPHPVLSGIAAAAWEGEPPTMLHSMRRDRSATDSTRESLVGLYLHGQTPDFAALDVGRTRRRISLPTYPFQRQRYWAEGTRHDSPSRHDSVHPLLGTEKRLASGEQVFNSEISVSSQPWTKDHWVFDRTIVPGAYHASLAVASAGVPCRLTDIEILRPLELDEGAREVEFVVQNDDGDRHTFESFTRASGDQRDEWQLHCRGSVAGKTEPSSNNAVPSVADLRSRLKPMSVDDFYSGTDAYGPSFQNLKQLWGEYGTGLAEVVVPASASGNDVTPAHPTILDTCFQTLVAATVRKSEDAVAEEMYLPFHIQQFNLRAPLRDRFYCIAHLRDTSPDNHETVTADIWIVAEDGELFGSMDAFVVKRATRNALVGRQVTEIKQCLYEKQWQEQPRLPQASECLPPAARVVDTVLETAAGWSDLQSLTPSIADVRQSMEIASRLYITQAWRQLGLHARVGDRLTASGLKESLEIKSSFERLLNRQFEILSASGQLQNIEGAWHVASELPEESPDPLIDRLLEEHSNCRIEVTLLRRCGDRLADVLQGREEPLSLLFPADGEGASELYRDSPVSQIFNRLVEQAFGTAMADIPSDRPIRILEIGGGSGGTTQAVLPKLPANCTYHFTDISASFVDQARQAYAEYPFVECRQLDISRSIEDQGFENDRYDIVLAANVLHATKDVQATLRNVHRLTAPTGMLLLLEATDRQAYLDLTFGLLNDWWSFSDDIRTDHPLLDIEAWKDLLQAENFDDIGCIAPEGISGQALFVARRGKHSVTRQDSPWLVVTNRQSKQFAEELQSRGENCLLIHTDAGHESNGKDFHVPFDSATQWRHLLEDLASTNAPRGIIHLCSLDSASTGETTIESLQDDTQQSCGGLLAIVQALVESRLPLPDGLSVVTRGGQIIDQEPAGSLAQSAVWGMSKVIAAEHPELKCRLFDLDPIGESNEFEQLAGEILAPSNEPELALRSGKCWAPRLRRLPIVEQSSARVDAEGTYLIVGGLGGLGLEAARWLASHGAQNLVLFGRSTPSDSVEAYLVELRQTVSQVHVTQGDVANESDVRKALSHIRNNLPPLKGVIHSAGVLRDGALANQDWSRFAEVLAPKMLGAFNLHQQTANENLDLFVLFSSTASLLGDRGQSCHAAANAFLDQLSRHRTSQNHPGLSVNWAPWSGVGAAAKRKELETRLSETGLRWISPAQGHVAFEEIMFGVTPQIGVADIDWQIFGEQFGDGQVPPLIESFVSPRKSHEPKRKRNDAILGKLQSGNANQQRAAYSKYVGQTVAAILHLPAPPEETVGFFDLGMDSMMAVELRNTLNTDLDLQPQLPSTIVFDFPNVRSLAEHLAEITNVASSTAESPTRSLAMTNEPIAVVGMSCRFPGGQDVDQFWQMLDEGRHGIREIPNDRWDFSSFYDPDRDVAGKMYAKHGGFVDDVDQFDAAFFRVSPREAVMLDPQQRLLLELTHDALENATLSPDDLRGERVGVFLGLCTQDYSQIVMRNGLCAVDPYTNSGNAHSTATGRISHVFGFNGPNMAVDTACSSSLVAVHQACNALRNIECDFSLVGGVNLMLIPDILVGWSRAQMLAPDGKCKTFDASADGFVRAEGCGVVVLKRLSDAQRDGDRILALIRGSAVNHDGASSGLTVPNGPAQERVIQAALQQAGASPDSIDYLEAHGTGTSLGDPVEVHAAAAALGQARPSERPLLIGSVKTNIGHLEAAAGIAGLIKVILSLQHNRIPAHLHFQSPNPHIAWDQLAVEVASQGADWPTGEQPRRAGVSSFGFSGTNAHVVIEEAPQSDVAVVSERPAEREGWLLPLSAKCDSALRQLAGDYRRWLQAHPESNLGDVCFTAGVGRSRLEHRAALVIRSHDETIERLAAIERGEESPGVVVGQTRNQPRTAWLFTGQGSQYAQMGRRLFEHEPVFRERLQACSDLLQDEFSLPLLEKLFEDGDSIHQTEITQPALFSLQVSLAELYGSLGMEPDALLGHSVGQYAAACVAGVFEWRDGLRLIANRGRLFGALPSGGAMAAVRAGVEEVQPWLGNALSVAAVNGPKQTVISGEESDLLSALQKLEQQGISSVRLTTSHAFHSALLEPALGDLAKHARAISMQAPERTLICNLSGEVCNVEDLRKEDYWSRHAREPVLFQAGVEQLQALGCDTLLEVGPNPVLCGLAASAWPEGTEPARLIGSLKRGQPDELSLLESMAKLFVAGAPIDFSALHSAWQRRKLALPSYPFQRQRYWVDAPDASSAALPAADSEGRSRLASGELVVRSRCGIDAQPWLVDHQVYGRVTIPGAMFLSMALEHSDGSLRSVTIPQALLLDDEQQQPELQLLVEPKESGGGFRIFSRDSDSDDSWTLHCEGQTQGDDVENADAVSTDWRGIHARLEPQSIEEFYQRASEGGIQFGPQFQRLTQLWSRGNEALGRIDGNVSGQASDNADLSVHPTLLDACFQVVAASGEVDSEGDVFVPFQLEQLRFDHPLPETFYCYARRRSGQESTERLETIVADLWIFDEEQRLLGTVSQLVLKRATLSAMQGPDKIDNWLYEVQWRDGERPADPSSFFPPPKMLSEQVRRAAVPLVEASGLTLPMSELNERLERWCARTVVQAWRRCGWAPEPGQPITPEPLRRSLGIDERHSRLIGRMLQILQQQNLLSVDGDSYLPQAELFELLDQDDAQLSQDVVQLAEDFAHAEIEITLLGRCGDQLADVLRGQVDPLSLLFPQQGVSASQLYRQSPASQVFNGLVRETVQRAITELPSDRTLRVLEVGAGTGATSEAVAPVLPAERCEYHFTDLSAGFFDSARERLDDYPFIGYRTLDLEDDPVQQGFAGESYDLVIAANVLHATRDLRQSVRDLRRLLAPGGYLVLLEAVQPQSWLDLTFGLLEGWWRFDDGLRDHALIDVARWRQLLEDCGFESPQAISPIGGPEQAVLVAQADERSAQSSGCWLILRDRSGVGDAIAEQLTDRGQSCTLIDLVEEGGWEQRSPDHYQLSLDDPSSWSSLGETLLGEQEGVPLRGVIHLWSLDAQSTLDSSSETLPRDLKRICGSALQLTQTLIKHSGAAPRLWMLTRGGQVVQPGESSGSLSQSTLWGMGAVIRSEHPELKPHLIDLPPCANDSPIVDQLVEELLRPSEEDQLALRTNQRLVPRLTRMELPQAVTKLDAGFQLQKCPHGTLDGLHFETVSESPAGPGQVKVKVRCAGLNFRDVLDALGIYPGSAHQIGGELSGTVIETGEGVSRFEIGDEVVGLAGGAFADTVSIPQEFLTHKPKKLRDDQAVTFPVAFATAQLAFDVCKLRAGDRVLIHAAAGGVGMACVQLAQLAGAEIFATASESKHDFLRSLGLTNIYNSRDASFAGDILEGTKGQGVNVVINSLTGDEFIEASLSVLESKGRFVEIGKRDIWTEERFQQTREDVQYHILALDQLALNSPSVLSDLLGRIMTAADEGQLKPLPTSTYEMSEASRAFRYMQQARHIGKIVLRAPDTAEDNATSTYLISGGLGGLGLETAEWLVERGVKNLILNGRTSPGLEAQSVIDRLRQAGASVSVELGDVSCDEDVKRIVQAAADGGRELTGIIHAAGVLRDRALINLQWEDCVDVFAAKVLGLFHLDKYTRDLSLKHFVLYSSIATQFGNRGQANHAAANAYLDQFANSLRNSGKSATSINWGPWRSTGAAAEREQALAEQLQISGFGWIDTSRGLEALSRVLASGESQVCVAPVDWSVFGRHITNSDLPHRMYADVLSESPREQQEFSNSNMRELLLETPQDARLAVFIDFVSHEFQQVLGLERPPSPETGFFELGMDSLMAVELRNRLQRALGDTFSISSTAVFDYPTLASLAEHLLEQAIPDEAQLEESETTDEMSVDELAEIFAKTLGDSADTTD